jgi:hypothetical protein
MIRPDPLVTLFLVQTAQTSSTTQTAQTRWRWEHQLEVLKVPKYIERKKFNEIWIGVISLMGHNSKREEDIIVIELGG